ncbi:MAG: T9SS type A sorting domain-containing protein [Bacteroidales bacterium]|nr:T9SS type A sorting domain-containing protein [Bacteroidales bacterium]
MRRIKSASILIGLLLLSISMSAQSYRYFKFTSTGDATCMISELEYMVGNVSYPTSKTGWGDTRVTSSVAIAYMAFDGAADWGPTMGVSGNWVIVDMSTAITITGLKVNMKQGALTGFTIYGSSSADPNGTWTQIYTENNISQTLESGVITYAIDAPGTKYTLTTSATNGTITRNPDQTAYESGTNVILTAAANVNYIFSNWSGDATGSSNPLTVKLDANKNIVANFTYQPNAQTSFTDDFNASTMTTGWYGTSQYVLSQLDGKLNVQVKKSGLWTSFVYDNITEMKLASAPYVNLKIKTETDLVLSIYLVHTSGKNILVTKRINRTNGFANVCFDFTGVYLPVGFTSLDQVQKMYFAVNGSGNSLNTKMQFDEIKVGSSAQRMSNFAGISDQVVYKNSTQNSFIITGIENASAFSFATQPTLINNVTFGAIDAAGNMRVTYDAVSGAVGEEVLTLQTTPTNGYVSNSYSLKLKVADNHAPTLIAPLTYNCKIGDNVISLKGITDGDPSAVQNISFQMSSDNAAVVKDVTADYVQGETAATLKFKALTVGTANIAVTLNDGQDVNNTTTKNITVNAYAKIPGFDDLKPISVVNNAGEQTVTITGVTDGDDNSQPLVLSAQSLNSTLIANPTVVYTSGNQATLKFTPVSGAIGKDTIAVSIAVNNGGNTGLVVTKNLVVDVQRPPLTGIIIPMLDYAGDRAKNLWNADYEENGIQTLSYEKDGADDVLHLALKGKTDWPGLWYNFNDPKLDIAENPYITLWVKSDSKIWFHLYFWDVKLGTDRRNNMEPTEEREIPANTWTKVTYDFYGKMKNKDGDPLKANQIESVLFNYHNVMFNYPFTTWANGNVWIKDIRIGDKADGTFVKQPICTVDDIPGLTLMSNAGAGTTTLKNVSDGKNGVAAVSVVSSNTAIVDNPTVVVNPNGTATLSYVPTGTAGSATITVTVSANGSTTTVKQFDIKIVDAATASSSSSTITVDVNTKYQTMRGIGAFLNDGAKTYINQYTNDLGATAVRLGVIGNHLEPLNDNNDPNVLDRSALNYNAFDWDFINDMKARGVETFILTLWSPPAWMKKNASEDYGFASAPQWESTDNKVDTVMYDEYAEYVYALCTVFKEKTGIDLYVGLQNEPAFNEPYSSAILNPAMFTKLIKTVGRRLLKEGITPRFYMAEQVINQNWTAYLDALRADKEASSYCSVNAVHMYQGDGTTDQSAKCSEWSTHKAIVENAADPKEFWMTERSPIVDTWDKILVLTSEMSSAFSCGNVSLWTQWDYNGTFITQGKSNQLTFAQSQFAKFAKAGAVRVDATTSNPNLFVSSYANTAKNGKTLATVVVNLSTEPVAITMAGNNIPTSYDVQQTYNAQNAKVTLNGMTKGVPYLLPAKSITTFSAPLDNAAPTINEIPVQRIDQDAAAQSVQLTGITDGGEGTQTVSIAASVTTGSGLISNVFVDYSSPNNTGVLHYTPVAGKTGLAVIKVEVSDNDTKNNKTVVYCNVNLKPATGIDEIASDRLRVYPNPAREMVKVQVPNSSYNDVKVINLMGQVLLEQPISSPVEQLNISDLKRGMYFIFVSGENKTLKTQFIVK